MTESPTVFIVDDDDDFRESLETLLVDAGHRVVAFPSAESFLDGLDGEVSGCVLLDVKMTGLSGLDVQEELEKRGVHMPVIILSGHVNVPMTVEAMRGGAIDVIQKPFRRKKLLACVEGAIRADEERREARLRSEECLQRLATLSDRELQIARLLAAGQAIKEVAHELGLSPNTVQTHRSNIHRKTETSSLVELANVVRDGYRD